LRSVTQSLFRQGAFALAGVAVLGAVHTGMSVAPRAQVPLKQVSQTPIVVPSIVVAEAAKPAIVAAPAPTLTKPPLKVACHCGPRPLAKKAVVAKPTGETLASEDVAYIAPAAEGPTLTKRLFAPVGFVTDRVGQLISWL
jgi:hypothetical protein